MSDAQNYHSSGQPSLPNDSLLSFLFLGLLLRLWLVERTKSAGISALVLALAQFVAVLSISDFSLARGDNFLMEGRTPILTAHVLAFGAFLAAVRFDRPHSLMLARIGLRLPAPALDRADQRHRRDVVLRWADIDGVLAGVLRRRATDDHVRSHDGASA